MSDRRRLRREDPVRSSPIRNWDSAKSAAEMWNRRGDQAFAEAPFSGEHFPGQEDPSAADDPRFEVEWTTSGGPDPEPNGSAWGDQKRRRTPPEADPRPEETAYRDESWRVPRFDNAAAEGVRMAYDLIDEHIRQGRDAAYEYRWPGARRPFANPIDDDLWGGIQRLMRFSEELIHLWRRLYGFDRRPFYAPPDPFTDRFDPRYAPGDPWQREPADGRRRPYEPSAGRSRRDDEPAAPAWDRRPRAHSREPRSQAFPSIELTAHGPTVIHLDLDSQAADRPLEVLELWDVEDNPPLTEVELNPGDKGPRLRISVPGDQPAGRYVGEILDRETGAPCGELQVWIRESELRADPAGSEESRTGADS